MGEAKPGKYFDRPILCASFKKYPNDALFWVEACHPCHQVTSAPYCVFLVGGWLYLNATGKRVL